MTTFGTRPDSCRSRWFLVRIRIRLTTRLSFHELQKIWTRTEVLDLRTHALPLSSQGSLFRSPSASRFLPLFSVSLCPLLPQLPLFSLRIGVFHAPRLNLPLRDVVSYFVLFLCTRSKPYRSRSDRSSSFGREEGVREHRGTAPCRAQVLRGQTTRC